MLNRVRAITAAIAISLLASGAAFAQSAPPPPAGLQAPLPPPPPGMPGFGHGHFHHHPEFGDHGLRPDASVLASLNALQQLYLEAGRRNELPGLYNEVLAKTHDPRLRAEIYRRLARAQLSPSHVDEAITSLRKSLDESLNAEAAFAAHRPAPGATH